MPARNVILNVAGEASASGSLEPEPEQRDGESGRGWGPGSGEQCGAPREIKDDVTASAHSIAVKSVAPAGAIKGTSQRI